MRLYDRRLYRVEVEIRRRVKAFWREFSRDDLRALARGDPEAMAKCKRLNGGEMMDLYRATLPPDKLAKLKRIEEEIRSHEVAE